MRFDGHSDDLAYINPLLAGQRNLLLLSMLLQNYDLVVDQTFRTYSDKDTTIETTFRAVLIKPDRQLGGLLVLECPKRKIA